jgi:hypothetical protein
MNYELALELKNEGFNFTGDAKSLSDGNGNYTENPTLSELIEACPKIYKEHNTEYFLDIGWNGSEWSVNYSWDESYASISGSGSTPEEALSKLWLELNKK